MTGKPDNSCGGVAEEDHPGDLPADGFGAQNFIAELGPSADALSALREACDGYEYASSIAES